MEDGEYVGLGDGWEMGSEVGEGGVLGWCAGNGQGWEWEWRYDKVERSGFGATRMVVVVGSNSSLTNLSFTL